MPSKWVDSIPDILLEANPASCCEMNQTWALRHRVHRWVGEKDSDAPIPERWAWAVGAMAAQGALSTLTPPRNQPLLSKKNKIERNVKGETCINTETREWRHLPTTDLDWLLLLLADSVEGFGGDSPGTEPAQVDNQTERQLASGQNSPTENIYMSIEKRLEGNTPKQWQYLFRGHRITKILIFFYIHSENIFFNKKNSL